MTQTTTVFRIAHLAVNNGEGVPAGPYHAHNTVEHSEDCNPGHMDLDTWDWVDGDIDPDCEKCILNEATEAIYGTTSSYNAPCPDEDGIWFQSGYHHSGFSSRDSMMEWMGAVLHVLDRAGFALFIYRVDNALVSHGGKQVAFPGHRSELVDIQPLV